MVSGQELGGDSGKIDSILCDQIVIKHSREKKGKWSDGLISFLKELSCFYTFVMQSKDAIATVLSHSLY